MPKVKICGITNAQDALWAANLGADFIGLNFCRQSPRKVSVKHAKRLVAAPAVLGQSLVLAWRAAARPALLSEGHCPA